MGSDVVHIDFTVLFATLTVTSFTQSCNEIGNIKWCQSQLRFHRAVNCDICINRHPTTHIIIYLTVLVTAVSYNETGNTMMLLSSPILLRRHVRGHLWNNRHPIYASGTMLTVSLSMTLRNRQQANAGNYFVNWIFTKLKFYKAISHDLWNNRHTTTLWTQVNYVVASWSFTNYQSWSLQPQAHNNALISCELCRCQLRFY